LDFFRIPVFPSETEARLIVHPNTVATFKIPFDGFQSIGRRNYQIVKIFRLIQHKELSEQPFLNIQRKFPGHFPFPD